MKAFIQSNFIIAIAIFFASCASQNHIELVGHYKPDTDVAKAQKTNAARQRDEISALPVQNSQQALASSDETAPDLNLLQSRLQQPGATIELTEKQKVKLEKKLDRIETKMEKQSAENKNVMQQTNQSFSSDKKSLSKDGDNDSKVLYAILAILLPPLAVALYEDDITAHFWISILLTLLFWIPGVIYALIIVLG